MPLGVWGSALDHISEKRRTNGDLLRKQNPRRPGAVGIPPDIKSSVPPQITSEYHRGPQAPGSRQRIFRVTCNFPNPAPQHQFDVRTVASWQAMPRSGGAQGATPKQHQPRSARCPAPVECSHSGLRQPNASSGDASLKATTPCPDPDVDRPATYHPHSFVRALISAAAVMNSFLNTRTLQQFCPFWFFTGKYTA